MYLYNAISVATFTIFKIFKNTDPSLLNPKFNKSLVGIEMILKIKIKFLNFFKNNNFKSDLF